MRAFCYPISGDSFKIPQPLPASFQDATMDVDGSLSMTWLIVAPDEDMEGVRGRIPPADSINQSEASENYDLFRLTFALTSEAR